MIFKGFTYYAVIIIAPTQKSLDCLHNEVRLI